MLRRIILIYIIFFLLLLLHCAPAHIMCAVRGRTHYEHLLTVVFISPPDNVMEVSRPPLAAVEQILHSPSVLHTPRGVPPQTRQQSHYYIYIDRV